VCHIISSCTGLLVLHHFFRSTMYYIVGFAVGAYVCLFLVSRLLKRHRGPIVGVASVTFLIVWWVVLLLETLKTRISSMLRWVHTWNVTAFHNAVTLQMTDMKRSYDLNFHPVPHGIIVSCEHYTMGFPVYYGSQKHHGCKEGKMSGRWWRVTLHVQTSSGRNCIPLMRWPNTNSVPKMPVTLPCNQHLICYVVTSPVHTVMIRCYIMR
jgi:hypothetical protein